MGHFSSAFEKQAQQIEKQIYEEVLPIAQSDNNKKVEDDLGELMDTALDPILSTLKMSWSDGRAIEIELSIDFFDYQELMVICKFLVHVLASLVT